MSRSVSKIRHIQETNKELEKRFIVEQESLVWGAAGSGIGAAAGSFVGMPWAGAAVGGALGELGYLIKSQIHSGKGSKEKIRNIIRLCDKSNEKPTSQSNQLATQIKNAIEGLGTTEKKIKEAFNSSGDMNGFCRIVKSYKQIAGEDLFDALDGDIDLDADWDYIYDPLYYLKDFWDEKNPLKPK